MKFSIYSLPVLWWLKLKEYVWAWCSSARQTASLFSPDSFLAGHAWWHAEQISFLSLKYNIFQISWCFCFCVTSWIWNRLKLSPGLLNFYRSYGNNCLVPAIIIYVLFFFLLIEYDKIILYWSPLRGNSGVTAVQGQKKALEINN